MSQITKIILILTFFTFVISLPAYILTITDSVICYITAFILCALIWVSIIHSIEMVDPFY
jgi:hypothetical protein